MRLNAKPRYKRAACARRSSPSVVSQTRNGQELISCSSHLSLSFSLSSGSLIFKFVSYITILIVRISSMDPKASKTLSVSFQLHKQASCFVKFVYLNSTFELNRHCAQNLNFERYQMWEDLTLLQRGFLFKGRLPVNSGQFLI